MILQVFIKLQRKDFILHILNGYVKSMNVFLKKKLVGFLICLIFEVCLVCVLSCQGNIQHQPLKLDGSSQCVFDPCIYVQFFKSEIYLLDKRGLNYTCFSQN